jgi:hypothetical protein
MNEFVSKKMGEVLAFARSGRDTLEKGEEAFLKLLDQEEIDEINEAFDELESRVVALAEEQEVIDDVEEGAEETLEKVTAMRDTYLDGSWDEESELLEWMGFYTGASLVHWRLIAGAAGALQFEELEKVSRDAIEFYTGLFVSDEETLQEIGAESVS